VEKYYRAGQASDDDIMGRMHIAWRLPKTTNTHLEYEIRIAFPQQQWLHERAPVLRYTYSALPVLLHYSCTVLVTVGLTVQILLAAVRTEMFNTDSFAFSPRLICACVVTSPQ